MNSWHKILVDTIDRCDRLWSLLDDYIDPKFLKVTLSMDNDCIVVYYLDPKKGRTLLRFAYRGAEENDLTVYHSKGYTLYGSLSETELTRLVRETLGEYDVED